MTTHSGSIYNLCDVDPNYVKHVAPAGFNPLAPSLDDLKPTPEL